MAHPLRTAPAEDAPASPLAELLASQASAVTVSQVEDMLLLTLDDRAGFEALRQALRDLCGAAPESFSGRMARIDLKARAIDLFDLRRLVHVLKDEFGVAVTGLYCTEENLHRYAERELKLRVFTTAAPAPVEPDAASSSPAPAEPPAAVPSPPPEPLAFVEAPEVVLDEVGQQEKVLTIPRSLRSGQVIRFGGDVIVFGDVNPGAEVAAGGNILVLGTIKGLTHAGAGGDDAAVIVAFDLRPVQLRIGKRIAVPPDDARGGPPRGAQPCVALVRDGRIVIEPYQGRLPR